MVLYVNFRQISEILKQWWHHLLNPVQTYHGKFNISMEWWKIKTYNMIVPMK